MSITHEQKYKARIYHGAYVISVLIPKGYLGLLVEGVLIEFQQKNLHSSVVVTVYDCKTISILLTMEKFIELYDGWQEWGWEKLYHHTIKLYSEGINNKQLHQVFIG